MARFQVTIDGETYHIDAELERRVQALEELLQDQSETVKANLEASKTFFQELEAHQAPETALSEEDTEELLKEASEVTPESLESLLEENENE